MERLYVELNCSPNQSMLTKGMKGYKHNYVRGADNVPYAVVVSGTIIDLVSVASLDACVNFTGNKEQKQQQSTSKAFDLCGVSNRYLLSYSIKDGTKYKEITHDNLSRMELDSLTDECLDSNINEWRVQLLDGC